MLEPMTANMTTEKLLIGDLNRQWVVGTDDCQYDNGQSLHKWRGYLKGSVMLGPMTANMTMENGENTYNLELLIWTVIFGIRWLSIKKWIGNVNNEEF